MVISDQTPTMEGQAQDFNVYTPTDNQTPFLTGFASPTTLV